jgi:hypothetical protein
VITAYLCIVFVMAFMALCLGLIGPGIVLMVTWFGIYLITRED